jgi:hypothetical protein
MKFKERIKSVLVENDKLLKQFRNEEREIVEEVVCDMTVVDRDMVMGIVVDMGTVEEAVMGDGRTTLTALILVVWMFLIQHVISVWQTGITSDKLDERM